MSYKKPVIKAKLHSADKAVSIADYDSLTSADNSKRLKEESRQDEIDKYNFNEIFNIDNHFKGIQLTGKSIIVRLFKENYIKDVTVLEDNVLYDAWLSQVDGRMNKTESPKWVDNPLPYIWSGVVVAMSPNVLADLVDEHNKVKFYDTTHKVLQVGDIVQLSPFMIADVRYYTNQQHRDFIKNPNEYRIEHFEGYVKLHPTQIDTVIKNKEAFMNTLSPYKSYKDGSEKTN